MRKKIFLYNKYFSTCGGGEKHAGGIAEVLSQKNDVTILHAGLVDLEKASDKLNLDFSKVRFVSLGKTMDIDFEVIDYVKKNKPDIFINATYLSSLLTDATVNIALVFFPKFNYTKIPSLADKIKHRIGNILFKEYSKIIRFHEGFGHDEYIHGNLGRWSYKHATLLIERPFKYINIYYENFKADIIRDLISAIKIHGNKLNFQILKNHLHVNFNSSSGSGLHLDFNTFKPNEREVGNTDQRDLGLFITLVESDALSLGSRILLKFWLNNSFKNYFNRLYIKWTVMKTYYYYKKFLSSNLNLANSKYTSGWIENIYGKKNKIEILYPPVDVEKFYSSPTKSNNIIAVGRFFVHGHNKKQLELIRIFKKMYDTYPEARNYNLHLCGGTHVETHNQEYKLLCMISAQGYPIHLHFDIPFGELKSLYADSKIFWHAAGMNENENIDPDKFEHFGITTVEAMASGCVPVVIGKAGQIEIVKHLDEGLLWNTEDELIADTIMLIKNEALMKTMSQKSIITAKKFSKKNFDANVKEVFSKLI